MRIGITDPMGVDDRFQSYAAWIALFAPQAEIVRLSHALGNLADADTCDAILLSGGGDVDPALYGGPVGHPKLSGVDPDRDTFEGAVMDGVFRRPRPFLGICRGMQFVNVYLGGTLLADVEDAGYRCHRSAPGAQALHEVAVAESGLLAGTVGAARVVVNSSHHQAVDRIAPALRAVATSDDGLVEALEMPGAKEVFLLVQWHPERLQDQSNPCGRRIAELFLRRPIATPEVTTHTRR